MPDTTKRFLPYMIGGDKIAVIAGKTENIAPTSSELAGALRVETIVNDLPNFFPNRDVLERKVRAYQQALSNAGMRPRIDGTLKYYYDDNIALNMHEFMITEQDKTGNFQFVWYERALNRTTYCLCTTDEKIPNITGQSGDEAMVEIPLWNDFEAESSQGDLFATTP